MGKASAPQAPDPVQTANAQTSSNRETAITQAGLNSVNQVTPYGNLTYSQNGTWADGTPRFTATQTLSPEGQQLYSTNAQTSQNLSNLARDSSQRLGGLLAAPIDWSQQQNYLNNFTDQALDRSWNRQQEQFNTDLVNRGIRPGSTQYQQLAGDFRTDRSNAYNAASVANFNTALQSQLALRQQPINEILALAGQGQLQTPNFVSTPATGVAGTDIAGLTQQNYANQYQNYANQQQQSNQALGGLFSAGAALLPLLSDERLKEDMFLVAKHPVGVEIFDYKRKDTGQRERGVIAQHLEKVRPDLVDNSHPDGFKRVWYSRLNKEFPDAYVHP